MSDHPPHDGPPELPPHVRTTSRRRAVLEAIAASPGAFEVVDLYDRARSIEPHISLATVYRTVELLRHSGAIRPLVGSDRPAYVRCDPHHHHHLVCTSCGSVEETELCAAPSAAVLKRRHGFSAHSHEMDIYGLCATCS
jgi:Fur family transcriptional regulator, ferric uptake regulator